MKSVNYLLLIILLLVHSPANAQTDTLVGVSAPKEMCRDYKDLAHFLCDDFSDEKAKANAIYNWITHNISYDVKASEKGNVKQPDAASALKTRKAVCGGYALLFTEMCREAGLKSVTIEGYAKDWMFDNGDKQYQPRHAWSAVLINGKWELADPTWGAGGMVQASSKLRKILNKICFGKLGYSKRLKFKFGYNPEYFMEDPEAYRLKHLPADPIWQLTDTLMPISLFEAGDSAVKKFNEISKPDQGKPELMRICGLSEEQRTFEMAERAYQYNNRYPLSMAVKYLYVATSTVEKAFIDTTVQNPDMLVATARLNLKKSEDYIKQQKKEFPEEYSTLRKKNKAKNQDARQNVRQIKTDDKRLAGQSKKYIKSSGAKKGKLNKKESQAAKRKQGVSLKKVDEIDASKVQKKKGSPELQALEDSVNSRSLQIANMSPLITDQKMRLEKGRLENRLRLDTLGGMFGESDSLLVKETVSRLQMHGSYDDEVKAISGKFREIKYKKVDTLVKYYLAEYDTLNNGFDRMLKTKIAQMDIYKKNLRTLEQWKKWSNNDPDVDERYKRCATDYLECIEEYTNMIDNYSEHLETSKKIFAVLAKGYARQIKVTGYMEKAEALRTKLESSTLNGRQAFDKKENEKQKALVKRIEKKVQQISEKMD